MSVNLYSFVEHPFTDKAYFNYGKFKDVVYKAQRLMDDIVDLEEEKINLILQKIENDPEPEEIKSVEKNLWIKIKDKLLKGRRTGLSAIGLADAFAALNIKYGSDNTPIGEEFSSWNATESSIQLAEEIYKQFAIAAYKSSIDMAKERGAFPIWNHSLENKNLFLHRVYDEFIKQEGDYSESVYGNIYKGRRNISLLTIPPSGSLAILAGISSGIEPIYQLYYKRRVKVTDNSEYNFIDDSGDKWKEYIVLHPKFKEWLKTYIYYSEDKLPFEEWINIQKQEDLEIFAKKSPYYKSTAYELDPLQRVKLQGTIQKWIDHSISSTINLPESITEEEISNIYIQAWKEGCKGITIYRDNCRTGVLVSTDKKEINKDTKFKQYSAPKRPKSLECEVFHISIRGEKFAVIVGLLENKPYEIFAISNGKDIIPNKGKGKLIKTGSGQYHITKDDESYFDIVIAMSDEEQIITRLISTALRHGTEVKFIVEQLSKTHGDLTSFGKAIARVLKSYIKNNEETKEVCPECKSKIIYKDGCKQCESCGWSKCG
jgi:ribonucleoside-diphosphate reductase alpha chain